MYSRRAASSWFFWVLAGLLSGCDSHPAATTAAPPTTLKKAQKPALPPADTADVSKFEYAAQWGAARTDTMFRVGGRRYFLHLRAQPDSSQQLQPALAVAPAVDSAGQPMRQAGDAAHFYNVRYTITLADSARQLFRRVFTKADFYGAVSKELAVESEPFAPEFQGFNAPRQLLLFRQLFAVDGTDWAGDAFVALDLTGRVRHLTKSNVYGGGGADCRIQQSPNGQAVITCNELLLPGGRHVSLRKPGSELTAARFLSDTTLLVAYDYVTIRRVKRKGEWQEEAVATPHHEHTPDFFILSARTGKPLASFRFGGIGDALGYILPREYVWQTRTYYLPDATARLLRVIPKDAPQRTYQVRYRDLPAFRAPQLPGEVKIILDMAADTSALYVNTRTRKLRYHAARE
jgi:hypothetical protein